MTIRTVVTGKNQLTIPAALARELDIAPGTEVEWRVEDGRYLVIEPVMSKAELLEHIRHAWKDIFPPDSDPVGDLIRERELEDEDVD